GNGNYSGSNSGCEPFTVNQAGSSTSSLVKDGTTTVDNTTHAAHGHKTHDNTPASVQVGTFSLAGTVTYSLYPTNDCSGTASTTDAEAVTSSGSFTASSLSAAVAASFPTRRSSDLGNGNYSGSNSGCEPFTVNQAGSSTSSLVKDGTTTVDNTTH